MLHTAGAVTGVTAGTAVSEFHSAAVQYNQQHAPTHPTCGLAMQSFSAEVQLHAGCTAAGREWKLQLVSTGDGGTRGHGDAAHAGGCMRHPPALWHAACCRVLAVSTGRHTQVLYVMFAVIMHSPSGLWLRSHSCKYKLPAGLLLAVGTCYIDNSNATLA